jgi:methionine synthase II (cobalamin-independent)
MTKPPRPIELTPDEWLSGRGHPTIELASPYDLVTNAEDRATIPERERRRDLAHRLAVALKEARQSSVGTQVAAAEAWGRAQSQVSRLEGDPTVVQLGTLIDYLAALNIRLTLHMVAGDDDIEVDLRHDVGDAA